LLDNDRLLGVFLAEESDVGLDDIKKFCTDCRYSSEMAWSVFAA
jgi:hypothetical protein